MHTCMYTYMCVLCVYVTYTEIYRYSISYIVIYKCSKLQEFSGEVSSLDRTVGSSKCGSKRCQVVLMFQKQIYLILPDK